MADLYDWAQWLNPSLRAWNWMLGGDAPDIPFVPSGQQGGVIPRLSVGRPGQGLGGLGMGGAPYTPQPPQIQQPTQVAPQPQIQGPVAPAAPRVVTPPLVPPNAPPGSMVRMAPTPMAMPSASRRFSSTRPSFIYTNPASAQQAAADLQSRLSFELGQDQGYRDYLARTSETNAATDRARINSDIYGQQLASASRDAEANRQSAERIAGMSEAIRQNRLAEAKYDDQLQKWQMGANVAAMLNADPNAKVDRKWAWLNPDTHKWEPVFPKPAPLATPVQAPGITAPGITAPVPPVAAPAPTQFIGPQIQSVMPPRMGPGIPIQMGPSPVTATPLSPFTYDPSLHNPMDWVGPAPISYWQLPYTPAPTPVAPANPVPSMWPPGMALPHPCLLYTSDAAD